MKDLPDRFVTIAALCILPWLFYLVYGLAQGYSFWIDELFSVVLSRQTWIEQLNVVLEDVHPPLYQLILSLWTSVFGVSEAAARALSAAFAAGSLVFAIGLGRMAGGLTGITFIILFLSNWLVFFYAQEVRAYAMLLFLSTAALFFFLTNRYRWLLAASLALSTTHFFGLLFALLCLLWTIVKDGQRGGAITVLALGLIWPVIYLLGPGGQAVLGGTFWIETRGLAIFPHATEAGWPQLTFFLRTLGLPQIGTSIFIVMMVSIAALRSRRNPFKPEVIKCLYLTFGAIGAVMVISIHTPVSTIRNFIILVAPMSFLLAVPVANALNSIGLKPARLLCLLVVFGLGHISISQQMQWRFSPAQDWKGASRSAADLAKTLGLTRVFAFEDIRKPVYKERFEFYLPETISVEMITKENLGSIPAGAILLFAHLPRTTPVGDACGNELTDALTALGRTGEVMFSTQSMTCRNGHILVQ